MAPSTHLRLRLVAPAAIASATAGGALLLYAREQTIQDAKSATLLLVAVLGLCTALFAAVRGLLRSLARSRIGGELVPAVEKQHVPSRGAERILVVDDERVVRELLAKVLRDEGYEVSAAGSAREARALESRWDLLITDVVMPETDGVKLAQQIDARHVLFISGYDQEALVRADAFFLQKPFSRDELARTVREMLDGERVSRHSAA